MPKKRPAIERFEEKYVPEPNSGCWLWTGSTKPSGYGRFRNGGILIPAHRFSYEFYKAPISEGLEIDHLCRVRCCVNPDHLEAVTKKENILRGIGTGAKYARRWQCNNGHPFVAGSFRIKSDGSRQCLACKRHWGALERRRKGIPCRKQP